MTGEARADADGYAADEVALLEMLWGEGFLSPGGEAEVARILGGRDIAGREVIDVGCGVGGAGLALVRRHEAATVTGLDVQRSLLDAAAERARRAGLADRVRYRLIDPGTLGLTDASCDVAFSKEAIIHVTDKERLFTEVHRALRPGGLLLVGDWFCGDDGELDDASGELLAAEGENFTMLSQAETARLVERIGFAEVEVEDRHAWYLGEATAERDRLRAGPFADAVRRRWGAEVADAQLDYWEMLVRTLRAGGLRPGHLRAVRR